MPIFNAKLEVVEYAKKVVAEQQPEGLLSWSAVVTGPFYDWVSKKKGRMMIGEKEKGERLTGKKQCLKLGYFGIDINNKKVTLYDEGKGVFTAVGRKTLRSYFSTGEMLFSKKRKHTKSIPHRD